MHWSKRLKLMRIAKVLIPLILVVMLIFTGFSVYADEAQNFVVRTQGDTGVQLSVTMDKSLENQTSMLLVDLTGTQTNTTFDPSATNEKEQGYIPANIAQLNGITNGVEPGGKNYTYVAFSFYLINNSSRAVDVDINMNIEGLIKNDNSLNHHIDDVLRVMYIEGEPLLNDTEYSVAPYTIYAKEEKNDENYSALKNSAPYMSDKYNIDIQPFYSSEYIFKREGDNGIRNMEKGEVRKFTIVLWLEGHDVECTNEIFGERAKMSVDFIGY